MSELVSIPEREPAGEVIYRLGGEIDAGLRRLAEHGVEPVAIRMGGGEKLALTLEADLIRGRVPGEPAMGFDLQGWVSPVRGKIIPIELQPEKGIVFVTG